LRVARRSRLWAPLGVVGSSSRPEHGQTPPRRADEKEHRISVLEIVAFYCGNGFAMVVGLQLRLVWQRRAKWPVASNGDRREPTQIIYVPLVVGRAANEDKASLFGRRRPDLPSRGFSPPELAPTCSRIVHRERVA
jgi:hypothetical protein